MQVYECMTANPIVIHPKTSYADAFRLMRVNKMHSLPVVDQNGCLVGIVTKKDFLCEMPVERVMTRQVMTVQEDCPLEEAACIMADHQIADLPVMSGWRLVGMITKTGAFRTMLEVLGGRSEGLRITISLQEDNGELGAITDGILQLGGKLISLCTFWGSDTHQRLITLKVQGLIRAELILMLESFIGVRVIDCRQSSAECQSEGTSYGMRMGAFPISDPEANTPWHKN